MPRKPMTVLGSRHNPRGVLPALEAKPCPTCYRPMHREAGAWSCDRHGKPTRP